MINVSDKFKQALFDDKRQFQIEATITLIDDTELTITNSELWSQGFEIDTSVSGNNSFDIGGLIIGRMTLVINNIYEDYTQYDFFDADVDVTLTLPFDDGTSESIVFDNFIVDEATDNESQIVLTCLDNAKHFERPYSESNLVYPASVDTIVRDACDTCGVPLLTTSIRNGNYVVPTRPSSDGLTFLKVVSWCAQLTGNFARINNHGQLVVGWYDRNTYDSVNKVNGTEWTITGNTAKKFHHIVSWSSLTVGTDDVTITGLRVVATSSDNTEFVGFYGNEGYVLEVRGNDLIGVSDVQNIANSIGANVVGLKLRTYNGACLGDPTIEASDLIWITDRKNRSYRSLICGTCFKLGQYQNLYCGAATPSRHSAVSYSESTRAIVKTRQEIRKSLADYDSRVSSMAELIARGFGMYFTPVTQQDGSVIPYIHDEPTIAESSYIAYMTSQGIMMESDGTTTAAVDRNGNALLNTLTARGINADWINSGAISIRDTQGNETFYANCLTGVVRINATSFSLTGSTIQQITQTAVGRIEVGGRNLIRNTRTYKDWYAYGTQYITYPEDNVVHFSASGLTGMVYSRTEGLITLKTDTLVNGGDKYVLSFEVMSPDWSEVSEVTTSKTGLAATCVSFVTYYSNTPGTYEKYNTRRLSDSFWENKPEQEDGKWLRFVSKPIDFSEFTWANSTHNFGEFMRVGPSLRANGDLYYRNFKLERGSKFTDWTPAPEDLQTGISNAVNTANSANATANSANATAQQALDVASSAGVLVAYLDNNYQSVPTDADGNYTTFPECSSKITVFYNSNDVSAQCTYATAVTSGVTGSWDNTTRTYSVTGLSTDSGTVTITAAYNDTSLSKKFTVIKVRQGISGTNGQNGRSISSMEEYYAISASNSTAPTSWSVNVVAPTEEYPYLWNYNRIVYDDNTQEDSQPRVIGNYARNGTDGQPGQNGQNGRGITSVTEHYGLSNSTTTEPTSWSDTMQVPTSSAKYLWNYETIAYTDGTSENTSKRIIGNFGADGNSAYNYELILSDVAIVKDGEGNITPQTITMTAKRGQGTSTPGNYAGRFKVEVTTNGTSYTTAYTSSANEATHTYTPTGNEKNIRVSLYLAGGTTTLLDSQNVPIVSDGADGFSPTVVSNKADGVTTVTITDANGTRSFTVNDGTDGASIATVTNYYLASASATGVTTSTSGWSTNPTSSSATITKDKPYLWNYEVSKDNNGKTITTTTPSVIGHFGSDGTNGTNGTNGKDGKGIASIEEYYAIFNSPTSAPSDSQFTKNVVAPTSTSRYLWNYEVVTYTDNSSEKTNKRVIGVYGDPGTSIKTIDNYYLASASATGVTTSTSGWSTNPTSSSATITKDKPYLWNYEVSKDNNGKTITTTTPSVIGHFGSDGTNGTNGTNGKGIKSISEYYALSNTTTAPDDSSFSLAVKTPSVASRYLWNYEKITYTDDSVTTTSKHIIGVYGDPATTVVLTNESHTFPGDVSNALASSFDCSVFAYSGTTRVPAKIGNITGLPSKGLSVTITNNETTTAKITVSSTTDLTLQSGTLNIPITVEGKTFTKKLAWSVAFRGRTGEGTPARSYFLDLSSKSVKYGENLRYFPSVLTAKSYYRDGASTSQMAYTGYIGVQVCIGTTWTTVKNFNASTVSLSLVSNSTATKATINNSNELTLPLNSTAIRFQLKATSSSSVYFDQQDTIILIDIESLTQEAIFNKLTNNSRDQGVYLENGKVYINAEYIQSWIMKLGGANNNNGLLDVYDANGNLVGYWTKDGIKLGGTLTDVHASTDAPNTLIDVNGKIETKRLVASENIKINGVPQAGIIGSSYDGYFIFPFGWSLYNDDDNYGKFELTENGLDIDTGYGTHIKAGVTSRLSVEDDESEETTFIGNDGISVNQDDAESSVLYTGPEASVKIDGFRVMENASTHSEEAAVTSDYIGIGGNSLKTSDAYMTKEGHIYGKRIAVSNATSDHIASYTFVDADSDEPTQYQLVDKSFASFVKTRSVSGTLTVPANSYADGTISLYSSGWTGWTPVAVSGFRATGSSYLSVLQVYINNGTALNYRLGCRGTSSDVSATFYAYVLYVRN